MGSKKSADEGGARMLKSLILNHLLSPCALLIQHFCKFTSIYFFCSKSANEHSICKYFGTSKIHSQEFTRQVFSYYYFYPAQSHSFSCTNTHIGDPSITPTQPCSCFEPITALHLVQQLRNIQEVRLKQL